MYYMLTLSAFAALPILAGTATTFGTDDQNHGPDVRSRRQSMLNLEADPSGDACGNNLISFADYVETHGRKYKSGSKEYEERKALFDQRAAEAQAHNCRPGKRFWTAGLTSLSDRTSEELARLRGRKGGFGETGQPTTSGGRTTRDRLATLASREGVVGERGEAGQGRKRLQPVPTSFSWAHLLSMKDAEVIDQGGCGSCWASATVAMLQAHTDIYLDHRKFSIQQLVSCVPNPEECGGSGGCNGSTGELALDYVMYNGLSTDVEFPYQDTEVACPSTMLAKNLKPVPQPNSSAFLATREDEPFASSPALSFGMIGWSRLPVNKVTPLFNALYREGPVAVSVVAGYSWNAYISGIMNNCTKEDMVVNHLVVLIGYGVDVGIDAKYWHIQNSWGHRWGETGHIRMIRQDDDKEETHCGADDNPLVGTGCKGGPPQVWVCGSCGILYDNVVAHFRGTSLMAQEMVKRQNNM